MFEIDLPDFTANRIFRYSHEQWATVTALLPEQHRNEPIKRAEIECGISDIVSDSPAVPPSNRDLIERWSKVQRLAKELRSALFAVLDPEENNAFDHTCSTLVQRADGQIECYVRSPKKSDAPIMILDT